MTDSNKLPSHLPPNYGSAKPAGGVKPRRTLLETIAHWGWIIVAFIPTVVINAVRLMVTPGTVAAQTVGGMIMLCGMLMSADAYWQLWSGQPALFHFFEDRWLGWGWVPQIKLGFLPPRFGFYPGLLFNGNFIFAILISSAVQMIQSVSFRSMVFKPTGVGGISAKTIGLVAWGSWAFDFIMAFSSRNPFAYSEPALRIGCLTYVLFSIFASELGYIVFMMLKESKD